MTIQIKMLGFGAGLAALAAAAPASAQYGYNYPPYGNAYGYNHNAAQFAANRCTAEVNARLYNRTGIGGLIGSLVGARSSARVVAVTQVTPRRNNIRVRGLASSGRYAYNPYGVGYYGAVGAGYMSDLSFSCTVDYRGRIRDVDINRRR